MTTRMRRALAVATTLLATISAAAMPASAMPANADKPTAAASVAPAAAAVRPALVAPAAPRTWHLVALGDSIPYGGSFCGYCRPYPSFLGATLARGSGHAVAVANLAVPGLTAAGLLENLRTRDALRRAVAGADIVTITIGHNDTPWNSRHDSCDGVHVFFGRYRDARWTTYTGPCLAKEARALEVRLSSILALVRTLRAGRPTLIEVTTDWNQLIGQAGVTASARRASKAVLDRFAEVTCATARAASARCGDVYHAFNGPDGTHSAGLLLAADHDHASQAGHREVALLLGRFGYAPLAK